MDRALRLVLALIVAACSATAEKGALFQKAPTGHPATPQPSATESDEPPPSADGASETYPAFVPEIAELVHNGGPVLKNPVIVTVTWPNESDVSSFEKLGDTIGATSYWREMVSEYGIGAATSGALNHVGMTAPLGASIDIDTLDLFAANNIRNPAASKWPAATDQTLYLLYFPAGTKVDANGVDACSTIDGFHTRAASTR